MSTTYAGGVILRKIEYTERFKKDYKKLSLKLQQRVDTKLRDLLTNPRPRGLAFEKLKGYKHPDIYTIHITGNYKMSLEIKGDLAILRRVSDHDTIDQTP